MTIQQMVARKARIEDKINALRAAGGHENHQKADSMVMEVAKLTVWIARRREAMQDDAQLLLPGFTERRYHQ